MGALCACITCWHVCMYVCLYAYIFVYVYVRVYGEERATRYHGTLQGFSEALFKYYIDVRYSCCLWFASVGLSISIFLSLYLALFIHLSLVFFSIFPLPFAHCVWHNAPIEQKRFQNS